MFFPVNFDLSYYKGSVYIAEHHWYLIEVGISTGRDKYDPSVLQSVIDNFLNTLYDYIKSDPKYDDYYIRVYRPVFTGIRIGQCVIKQLKTDSGHITNLLASICPHGRIATLRSFTETGGYGKYITEQPSKRRHRLD